MSNTTMEKPPTIQSLIDGPKKKISVYLADMHLEKIFIFESGLRDTVTFREYRAAFLSLNNLWHLGDTSQEAVEITIPCKAV